MSVNDKELQDLKDRMLVWLYELKRPAYSWDFHDNFKCCKRLVNIAVYSLLSERLIERENGQYSLTNEGIRRAINLMWQGK
jgi:predicted transcriptional regulator